MTVCNWLSIKFFRAGQAFNRILVLFLFLCSSSLINAQIVVQEATSQADVENLVNNVLLNSCVSISNIQYTGAYRAIASFDGTASNIGLNSGVLITNGRGTNALGPNNMANRSTNNALAGDAQLTVLAGANTFDASILEFDFIPFSDTIRFEYIYASEEYNEYVGLFNDPMAFFISGPGYPTATNIARIPGTSTPVSINTINNGYSPTCPATGPCVSCAYHVDNCGGTTVQYDGFTRPMTAFAVVQPCVQYHIKIAIADALDRIFDSALFLKAGSFTSGSAANVTVSTLNNINTVYEGCNAGFRFTRLDSADNSLPVTVSYAITGTATNGTDYTTIPVTITIPAGQNSTTLPIHALTDGTAEGNQALTISLGSSGCNCNAPPTATLTIQDNTTLTASSTGTTTICLGQSTTLTATGAGSQAPYSYSWNNGAGNNSSVTVSPTQTTTYIVTVTDACNGQTTTRQETVTVIHAGFTVTGSSPQCVSGNSFTFNNTGTTGPGINYTWDFGDGSPTETTLSPTHVYTTAGTFTVTQTLSNGTCTLTQTSTVQLSASPTAIITGNNSFCSGGSPVLSASTSTPGSGTITSYQWQLNGNNIAGATAVTYTASTSGDYTVVVTNSGSCSTTSAAFTVSSSGSPTATITGNATACAGSNNTLSAASSVPGSGTITGYQWQLNGTAISGATAVTYTAGTTGNYTVTVTNSFGCTATSSPFSLTVYASPVATITGTHSYCAGSNAPLSAASSTAGSGVISSYQWQLNGSNIAGATAATYTALSSGDYTVVITNSNSCTTTSAIWTVTEFTNPTVVISSFTNVGCPGNNDGTATATASSGSGVYTYLWQPGGQTTAAVNNLSPGLNAITVTDGNGCTATTSVNITATDNIPPVAVCQDITVLLNPLGNVSVSGADIDGGSTDNCGISSVTATPNTFDCSNLGDNSVILTVIDASGNSSTCTSTVSVQYGTIPAPDCGNVTTYVSTAGTVSVDENDIVLNLPSLCGVASIDLSQSDFTCAELGANAVDLTIIYTSGDSTSCSATINVLDTINPVILNCPADIQITPNIAGCMATVSWTIPQMSDNCSYSVISSHTPGDTFPVGSTTVSYNVTDPSGNTAQCELTIDVLSVPVGVTLQPQVYACGNTISCPGSGDGNITATVTGGCPPYQYNWSNGGTASSINGLIAGTYQVTVTDAGGEQATGTVTLTEPAPITLNSIQLSTYPGGLNISCNGATDGSIDPDLSGGADCQAYTYSWSGPGGFASTDEAITSLSAGTYSLTVTDANGCIHNESIILTEPTALIINTTSVTDVTCFGTANGSASISVNGGVSPYQYAWSNGETTNQVTNLPAGPIDVTVTDANGCTGSLTIQILQPVEMAVSVQVTSDYNGFAVSCPGASDGAVTATVAGGNSPYQFQWSTTETSQTISGLAEGSYTVDVTDNSGCTVQSGIQLTAPPAITSIFQVQNPACNGMLNGSAEVIPAGGVTPYSYSWVTGETSQLISGVGTGLYTVTITDANGCSAIDDTLLTEPTPLEISIVFINDVSCSGMADGSIDIQVTGGTPSYFYAWSDGSTTQDLQGLTAGTYHLNVRDVNACSDTISVIVTEPVSLIINVADPPTVCPGAEAQITAIVSGGNIPYSYAWSNGQSGAVISVFPQQEEILSVTVTDAEGCSVVANNIDITLYPSPTASFALSEAASCTSPVDVITINNSNGASQYTWTDGNITVNSTTVLFTFTAPGSYPITLVAANSVGCTDTAVQIFTVYENPVAAFLPSPASGCPQLSVSFTDQSTGALQYSWSFGDSSTSALSNPTHLYDETGAYTVRLIVTGAGGCTDTVTMNNAVTVFPVPVADFTWDYLDPYDPDGRIIFTNTSQGAATYNWTFGDGNSSTAENPVNNYQSSGSFSITLTAVNSYGCSDTATEDAEPLVDGGLYIPNCMIVGEDGDVGVFLPKGRGIATYTCIIYDKWGNLLWETNKLENGRPVESWDGRYKGEVVPQGAYVWQATAVFEDGKIWQGMPFENGERKYIGTITVLQ